jgi:protein-S-isoprenylcysteine O-methyltransferase Ste14
MSIPVSSHPELKGTSLLRLVVVNFLQMGFMFTLIGVILFVAAGRLDWWEAWVFLVVYFLIAVASNVWMLYFDRALLQERTQAASKPDSKSWDSVIVTANLLLTAALFAMIGVDAGRYGWSVVPSWLRILAGVGVLASFGLTTWASRVNTFMSARVRIQAERGHHAITAGPYARVRHPMYASMCLLDLSLPLLLGSWWGLVVSALMIAAVVIRTVLEDNTLQQELPGYLEYTRQVRWRLLPGVW